MRSTPLFPAIFVNRLFQNSAILELKIEFVKRSKTLPRLVRFISMVAVLAVLISSPVSIAAPGSRVTFDDAGIAVVDGKPFFPIGVFTYNIDPTVLAELHEVHANTVLNGFQPNQLDLLHKHGLMAVCFTSEDWIKAAASHPALLAWYLTDEPENRGVTPESETKRYDELKKRDPNHPIGLDHTAFEAISKFKDACDFTMSDIYPITKNRDQNVMGVSIMMDEARRIHGQAWPHWTYIQTFGGPETDNGVWAVPLPHEVRFMAYQALVHRATGILYFSYWPQQPRTWQSLAMLNREIHTLVPRLVAPGKEAMLTTENPSIQARMRTSPGAKSGLIIAINTSPKFVHTAIEARGAPTELSLPFETRNVQLTSESKINDRFEPYGVHVYTWGLEPAVELGREK